MSSTSTTLPRGVNAGIHRPNLHYRVIAVTSEEEKQARLLQLVRQTEGAGIVYTATVQAAEEVAQSLRQVGESVTVYHGRLAARERAASQEMFMAGERRLMVATNAFGMGIDKDDIRFVLHYQIPGSLEAYYQESGRAGRDNLAAECVLLYYLKDKRIQQFFLARRYPAAGQVSAAYAALRTLAEDRGEIPFDALKAAVDAIPAGKLLVALKLLQDEGLVARDTDGSVRLLAPDAGPDRVAGLAASCDEKSERDRDALERMVFYAQTGFCRWKVLLDYFGEQADWDRCGGCDNCLHPPERDLGAALPRERRRHARRPRTSSSLQAGCLARVPKFGEGQVVSVSGDKVTILFPDSRTRTFLSSFVQAQ